MTHDQLIELMAEAHWNTAAGVPWAEFMRDHPESRKFYIDAMQSAFDALERQHEINRASESV